MTKLHLRHGAFLATATGFMLCLSTLPGWADEINAASRVTAATIFPDRAAITREARVQVPAGAHTIVIPNVPPGLEENSLRVEGKGGEKVKIGTVEVKRIFLTEAANAAQRDKLAAIEAKQDEKALIEGDIKALGNREEFIENIAAAGTEKTDGNGVTKLDFAPDKWAQAWGLVQNGIAETQKNLVTRNADLRKANAQIAALQQELAQIQSTQARERRDVRVQIEADAATDLNLSINYQTTGVQWAPVYDARLNTADASLALEQYGMAMQNTGEDWNDIALTFSTAQPSRGSEMPVLGPWVVDIVKYAEARAASYAMLAAPASAGAALRMKSVNAAAMQEDKDVDAVLAQAAVQATEYAAEFRVPGHVDLKSANDSTKLFIGSARLTAALGARTTPRLVPQAYLFAKATNGEKYPLIPGTVAKYRDGAFIGNSMMPMLRSNETADLSFGVDDHIKVTYKRTKEEKSNPTFAMVGDTKTERQYETKIQNLHKDAIDVTIFEQFPTSGDGDVKSELVDSATTPGYTKDPENRQNVLSWNVKLQPQEEKTYSIGFVVKYPKDKPIAGL